MTRSLKVYIFSVLVISAILISWFIFRDWPAPQNESQVLNRMIKLQDEGRYDKAVQVVQNWLNDGRRNFAHDDFLYDQVAMVYIAKAYKKPATKEESIHQAELNLGKALDFFNRKEPEDADIELDGIGGAYEIMGDLSDMGKCQFYEKARQAFVRQLPLIKGDSYTAYGKTIRLEPVRAEVRKHLDGANEKSLKAGCEVR